MARYFAFLSYSSRDRAEAEWLHRRLERFRLPRALVGRVTVHGPVPRRLYPVFRDRDELPASGDLGRELTAALAASRFLIVLASPDAAASRWVNEEIMTFKRLHGGDRVLALVVGGVPGASAMPGRECEEAFPAALRLRVCKDGALLPEPAEPVAADLREEGDGRRLAFLKLVAGLTGVGLDDLIQRDAQRRARRLGALAAGALAGMVLASGLALYADRQRREAEAQRAIAERETAAAQAATDYLIGTFELSNPAIENPRTVPLVSILDRSAERAQVELAGQPDILARIATAVGRVYINLGLFEEAERALRRASAAIPASGPQGAVALATLADTQQRRGMIREAERTLAAAEAALGPAPGRFPVETATVAQMQGRLALAAGRMDEALAHYDRAVALLDARPDADVLLHARALQGRGSILSDLGSHAEAEAALLEANRIWRAQRGERHFDTGRSWYALALNAYLAGDLLAARQRIDTSLAILARMLDRTNPIRADALSLQGQILHGQGRNREAARALGEAVEAYREAVGEPHYLIGIANVYQARVASALGETATALGHLESARRNYDGSYGRLHPNHGDLLVNRAQILSAAGRGAEAEADCRAGLAILDATLGPDNGFTRQLRETCLALGPASG